MNASVVRSADVAILLCTYNGSSHLRDQLSSYEHQTHKEWTVFASDDGSVDDTVAILSSYADRWGQDRLIVRAGPKQGFAANFMSLVRDSDISASYYAYSDQDDIWNPDKLDSAVAWLREIPEHTPALYCSGTVLVGDDNKEIGRSRFYKKPPSFSNALVQNIASGNTMVFNQAARDLLCVPPVAECIFYHDWWAYLAVTACGGVVNFDSKPSLRYRQHDNNQVGAKTGMARLSQGLDKLLDGKFRRWTEGNIALLTCLDQHLSESSKITLGHFIRARQSSLFPRLMLFRKSGVHRQTFIDNVGLLAAEVLGKV